MGEKMKILGFTGLPCSGKDAACEHVMKKCGYKFLSCGDVVRNFAKTVRGIPNPTREDQQAIGYEMRKKEGETWLLKRLVENLPDGNYVISGVRGMHERKFLKEKFGSDFALVGLISSEQTRFERCVKRGRSGDATTLEGFSEMDVKDLRLGDGDSTVLSDYFIINEGTLDDFHGDIDKVVQAFSQPGK